eukprot:3941285-Rhodomonas_salina.3
MPHASFSLTLSLSLAAQCAEGILTSLAGALTTIVKRILALRDESAREALRPHESGAAGLEDAPHHLHSDSDSAEHRAQSTEHRALDAFSNSNQWTRHSGSTAQRSMRWKRCSRSKACDRSDADMRGVPGCEATQPGRGFWSTAFDIISIHVACEAMVVIALVWRRRRERTRQFSIPHPRPSTLNSQPSTLKPSNFKPQHSDACAPVMAKQQEPPGMTFFAQAVSHRSVHVRAGHHDPRP